MMQLRLHLTDESFLERRSALRHLDGAPFALVRELMPEILYCLNCDDEEAQVISRALVKRHLVEPGTAVHAAGTVRMRGLAAHGLLGVLEEALGETRDPEIADALACALYTAGAAAERALPHLLVAAARPSQHAVQLLGVIRDAAARPILTDLVGSAHPLVAADARAALARLDGEPTTIRWTSFEPVLGLVRPLVSRLGLQTAVMEAAAGRSQPTALDEWEAEGALEEQVSIIRAPASAFVTADAFWVASALGDVGGAAASPALAMIDRLDLVPLRQSSAELLVDELFRRVEDEPPLALDGRFVGATQTGYLGLESELLLQTTAEYLRVFWYTTA